MGFPSGICRPRRPCWQCFPVFALFALWSPPSARAFWRDAGIFTALGVELFALVTAVSYAAGSLSVTADGWLKVVPLVMAEFALFNLVLLMGGRATNRLRHWFFGTDPSAPEFAPVSREERLVFGLLAGVGLMGLGVGVAYLRVETRNLQTRSIEVLQRMADLKVGQIEQWRRERLGDARSLMRMPGLGGNITAISEPRGTRPHSAPDLSHGCSNSSGVTATRMSWCSTRHCGRCCPNRARWISLRRNCAKGCARSGQTRT